MLNNTTGSNNNSHTRSKTNLCSKVLCFFFLKNIITEMEEEIMTERKMGNQHGIVYFSF